MKKRRRDKQDTTFAEVLQRKGQEEGLPPESLKEIAGGSVNRSP